MSARRGAILTCLLLALAAARLAAQAPVAAGPWVPIGSRLDRLVAWMVDEGALPGVDPLTRPWRLAAVRAAVQRADTTDLSVAGHRAWRDLARELADASDSTIVTAEAGVETHRNGRRDSFRAGGARGTGPMGGIWTSLVRGPWVAVINPAFENRLLDDPEFTGKRDRAVAGRLQSGYLALTGERGDLLFGRTARNWGPALFDGLQLSPSAYATDQLVGTLREGRFELTSIAQRLDDYDTTLSAAVTRWFLAHRLGIRAGRGTWIALTETGVYGGPGRGFEPMLHAPFNLALLSEFNDHERVNLTWSAELHAPLSRRVAFDGQLMIDDIQIEKDTATGLTRPWSGGFSAALTAALPGAPVHAALGYTRVRSVTYRNDADPWDVYAVSGVGIARNFADYDEILLRLAAHPAPTLDVAAEVARFRQGAGDFRQPFPSDSQLAQPHMSFLVPPVASWTAARVTVDAEPWRGIGLTAEAGSTRGVSGGSAAIASFAVRVGVDVVHRRLGGAFPGVERSWR